MYQITENMIRIVRAIKAPGANHRNWYNTIRPIVSEILKRRISNKIEDKNEVLTLLLDTLVSLGKADVRTLKSCFNVAFRPDTYRPQEKAIDRVIEELCGHIQMIKVEDQHLKVRRKAPLPADVLSN